MVNSIWQKVRDWLTPKLDAEGWEVYASTVLWDEHDAKHVFRQYRRKLSRFNYEFKEDPMPLWADNAEQAYYKRQY
ncbi:hypothetical protein [Devosia beringensis]|uniref:hypothetical protein n=1 Tax=Devosia beringensis TaxID=2657486 RepID=UPI00186B65E3|nr:hypothetical protein [Devosia beringensis]